MEIRLDRTAFRTTPPASKDKEMQPFTRFYPDDDDPWGGRLVVRREKTPVGAGSALLLSPFPSSPGSRAMLMAIRRASSFVSTFAWRASGLVLS
jgi:hypothetical protein